MHSIAYENKNKLFFLPVNKWTRNFYFVSLFFFYVSDQLSNAIHKCSGVYAFVKIKIKRRKRKRNQPQKLTYTKNRIFKFKTKLLNTHTQHTQDIFKEEKTTKYQYNCNENVKWYLRFL